MNILAELRSRFRPALTPFTDELGTYLSMVKPAQDARFGDFQANCAMPLSKQRGINPRELAAQIVERLDVADICQAPEIAGPGFINLTLRDDWLETETNRLIKDDRLGVVPVADPRKVIVDYSAPNVAKPMHVGHLRSTVIGSALCRILAFLGNEVVGDNHIGDWGTQFGMIIFGYKRFVDQAAFDRDPVGELARLYRVVSQLCEYQDALADLPKLREQLDEAQSEMERARPAPGEKDPQAKKHVKKQRANVEKITADITDCERKRSLVEDDPELRSLATAHPDIVPDSRQETARLHAGDAENRRLWNEFLPQCLDALQSVYNRLDVTFDLSLGESYYQPLLADVVEELESGGLARQSEGATCVFLEGKEAPFIIRKQDGAYTYATTDLATIKYRRENLQAEAVLYVVDARQAVHFNMLFETARRWGFDNIEFRHVSFGTVLGADRRPFKTRSGDTVGLESLIDEAVVRARKIVDENDDAKPNPELDEEARRDVAEAVGIGGIKYADLHHNRESDYVFDWDKMLAKTGDTATYMQYSYARICGIFRKGSVDREALRLSGTQIKLACAEERNLALRINRFADELASAAQELRPNILTQYLFETATSFSSFYEACSVLKEESAATRNSRLLLCDLTARLLAWGLRLLGIRACEQM
jgi:arginyl-tRNA synthetase